MCAVVVLFYLNARYTERTKEEMTKAASSPSRVEISVLSMTNGDRGWMAARDDQPLENAVGSAEALTGSGVKGGMSQVAGRLTCSEAIMVDMLFQVRRISPEVRTKKRAITSSVLGESAGVARLFSRRSPGDGAGRANRSMTAGDSTSVPDKS